MLRTCFVLILIALVALPGCDEQILDDASQVPWFKHVVGARYEVVGPVVAYGIRKHSKAAVDYITLIPPPGIEGSEVAFRIPIEIGSRITVLKVYKTNRVFDPDMTLGIQLEGTRMPVETTLRIDLFRGNEGKGPVQLNPAIYRQISP